MSSLAGKVFSVTGGASGMGLATVRKLASSGAKAVCVGDFNDANFSTLEPELKTQYPNTSFLFTKLDVSSSASVNTWIDTIVTTYGALDGSLNAAGIPQVTGERAAPAIIEETDESWNRTIGVNLNGVFFCMRAQVKAMMAFHEKEKEKGEKRSRSIVNIASMAALRYQTDIFAYCTSKWAAAVLTTSVAKDVSDFGIRVNAVSPGGTKTPMLMKFVGPRAREMAAKAHGKIPYDLIEPEEIADVVAWLLSDDSVRVNGTNIPVGCNLP